MDASIEELRTLPNAILKQMRFRHLVQCGKIMNVLFERGDSVESTITREMLLQNGWIEKPGILVLKNPIIRLGWVPTTKKFIIGYGELPKPIETVGQLIDIYKLCGLYELADNLLK